MNFKFFYLRLYFVNYRSQTIRLVPSKFEVDLIMKIVIGSVDEIEKSIDEFVANKNEI